MNNQSDTSEFGASLRQWRDRRRLSQLDLALHADVSARHVSFLETGRSRPSRGMVLRLCERLELPLQARNQLLVAAGLAPHYGMRSREQPDMKPASAAIDWMLDRHHPYPAVTIDRHWRLVQMNPAASTLFDLVGLGSGDSLLDAVCDNGEVAESIENIDQLRHYLAARLNTEIAHFGPDPVLVAAHKRMVGLLDHPVDRASAAPSPVVPAIYRAAGQRLSLFSTISHFGTAEDIALSELRIELLFPADEQTRLALMALT